LRVQVYAHDFSSPVWKIDGRILPFCNTLTRHSFKGIG
jgi:hypothetical protein